MAESTKKQQASNGTEKKSSGNNPQKKTVDSPKSPFNKRNCIYWSFIALEVIAILICIVVEVGKSRQYKAEAHSPQAIKEVQALTADPIEDTAPTQTTTTPKPVEETPVIEEVEEEKADTASAQVASEASEEGSDSLAVSEPAEPSTTNYYAVVKTGSSLEGAKNELKGLPEGLRADAHIYSFEKDGKTTYIICVACSSNRESVQQKVNTAHAELGDAYLRTGTGSETLVE